MYAEHQGVNGTVRSVASQCRRLIAIDLVVDMAVQARPRLCLYSGHAMDASVCTD